MSFAIKLIACFSIFVLLPLYFLSSGGVYKGESSDSSDDQQQLILPATTVTGNQANISFVSVIEVRETVSRQLDRSYAGTVVARRSSDVGFNQPGRIVSLLVDQGDEVAKDQELAKLDLAELHAQLSEMEAEKLAAEAQLQELQAGPRKQTIQAARLKVNELASLRDQAKQYHQRVSSLAGTDAIASRDVDDASHQMAAAEARLLQQQQALEELLAGTRVEQIDTQKAVVEKLSASIKRLQILLDQGTLRAPFSGVIARRFVDDGSVVEPGSAVLRVVETQQPEAWIGVPENRSAALKVSEFYDITVGSIKCSGELVTVLPEVDESTRTRTAIFRLALPKENITQGLASAPAIGSLAQLTLTHSLQEEGIWIPLASLTRGTRGLWAVYVVVNEDGLQRAQRRDVEILQVDSNQVLVRGGLLDGDQLIVSGVQKITNGQQVQTAL